VIVDQPSPAFLRELFLQVSHQLDAPAEALAAGRQSDVGRRAIRVADGERGEAHAEEARTDAAETSTDADEVRQVELLRPQLLGDERAEGRMLDAASREVAGL